MLSVVQQGLTKAQAARKYQVSWRWVHILVTRYQAAGTLDAVAPRSTRPHSNSRQLPEPLRELIVRLRDQLTAGGLDAGPVSIQDQLRSLGERIPSTSTIRRVLVSADRITAEPKKRPRASLHRFAADQPNECWQSDFTHWQLADATGVEILNWLDDHSRYLLGCTAHYRVTGDHVITDFTRLTSVYGVPASTLTDNGSVYTSRFTGGRNGFEYLLQRLGVTQKNGHPNHPQTQGKIERFHQTLKRWLTAQPPTTTLADLQAQLDLFRQIYNHQRAHRALNGATPAHAYSTTPKADPSPHRSAPHYRVRHDRVDTAGHLSLRRAGRMHHLGVGRAHAGTPVLILTDPTTVTVINTTTGQVLSEHDIDPTRAYWRNKNKSPGRWPGL